MLGASPTRLIAIAKLLPFAKNARAGRLRVADLLESFEHAPLLQNIVVRRHTGPRDRYEVIAGARRVEAARQMGWSHIEAKVVDVVDDRALAYSLEENLRRRALPDETTAFAKLLDLYRREHPPRLGGDRRSVGFQSGKFVRTDGAATRLARIVGQTPREIRRKARIGRLGSAKLKAALAAGEVNVLQAEMLAGRPRSEQDRRLATLLRAKAQPEIARDIAKAIDCLAYAEKVLTRYRGQRTDREAIALVERHLEALSALVRSIRRQR